MTLECGVTLSERVAYVVSALEEYRANPATPPSSALDAVAMALEAGAAAAGLAGGRGWKGLQAGHVTSAQMVRQLASAMRGLLPPRVEDVLPPRVEDVLPPAPPPSPTEEMTRLSYDIAPSAPDPFGDIAPGSRGRSPLPWSYLLPLLDQTPSSGSMSVSRAGVLAECSLRHGLRRVAEMFPDGPVPRPRPSWAAIGGTAVHEWLEDVEGAVFAKGDIPDVDDDWEDYLRSTARLRLAGTSYQERDMDGPDPGRRGEGFDWWRVEGATMIKRYIAYHDSAYRQRWRLAEKADGAPMLEWRFELPLDRATELIGAIDAVWIDGETGGRYVVDYKTGTFPASPTQLATYVHALERVYGGVAAGARVWDARKGAYLDIPRASASSWEPLRRRFLVAAKIEAERLWLANPGQQCQRCGYGDICPGRETL